MVTPLPKTTTATKRIPTKTKNKKKNDIKLKPNKKITTMKQEKLTKQLQ